MTKIKSITYCGEEEQQCILVNSPDHLYITNNNIITHNTIICGAITEFGFFIDAGWSETKIMTFFNKLRKRIDSRMNNHYYGRFVIDSSPNTLESPIDDWILNNATASSENYILRGSRWKLFPDAFPEFYDENKNEIHDFAHAFPLYKGGNGHPAAVIDNQMQLEQYDPIDIIWCPLFFNAVSFKDKALENPIEFLKDWAGIPAGQADRIFYDGSKITACFNNNLRNLYGSIVASADDEPEHLIWNQIRDKFFNKVIDKYYFYYNPEIPRVLSVDQSTAQDCTGIAMSHYERDPEKKDPITGESLRCIVTDFIITIIPAGGTINLDAIRYFIFDLIELGNLNIKHVSFDNFQYDPTRQGLKRKGIVVDYVTVDKSNDAYLTFIDYVNKQRWHCGKCIYAINNMKSLQMQHRKTTNTIKIEHIKGDLVQDDSNPLAGINAKDSIDPVAANCQLLN